MHTSIKQLLHTHSSVLFPGTDAVDCQVADIERLVQLVVMECAAVIRADAFKFPEADITWRCAMEESATTISKHFGIA